jgi:predicted DNA binding CopG/RHH family protein
MNKQKKLKKIPQFKNEDEERNFWAQADSADYVDWSKAEAAVFPNLRPSTETISLRLPKFTLYHLKTMANKMDVPYQSLIKIILNDKIEQEMKR